MVSGSRFEVPLADFEEAALLGLWRSARHWPANSVIDATDGVRLITSTTES